MSQNENKICKFILVLIIICIIIWFWPVLLNKPFFDNSGNYYDNNPKQIAPGDHPEFEDPVFEDGVLDVEITPPNNNGGAVACTMEAKACPDGSYVGRTGPNCEFAPCPGN